jgi:hypothetical protein
VRVVARKFWREAAYKPHGLFRRAVFQPQHDAPAGSKGNRRVGMAPGCRHRENRGGLLQVRSELLIFLRRRSLA